ncbi:helix-turn-helix domain-containing protein [Saccharothrix deserti]|uniref:helix-turn-helix domain-containing protein n=1 Tax=Saccharothrix deserti TaxID=2593674 RepID=UPI00131AB8D3
MELHRSRPHAPAHQEVSTARSRELGEEIRQVWQRAGIPVARLTKSLGWSPGKLSKIQTGTRGTSLVDIATLLGYCGADRETRDRIMSMAAETDRNAGSFVRVHDGCPDTLLVLTLHEQWARTVTVYEPLAVPSLAQTEEYAYALTGSKTTARARTARQHHLRRPGGPNIVVYVHEAAFHQIVGSPKVMHDQLLRLTLMCNWIGTSPRVIPTSAQSHSALQHPAAVLTFADPLDPLAYTEIDGATVFHDAPPRRGRISGKNAATRHVGTGRQGLSEATRPMGRHLRRRKHARLRARE